MRKLLATVLALTMLYGAVALGNYTATQGSGLSFGSIIVGSVHYAQQFLCDLTTPAQCATVNSDGTVSVKGVGVAQATPIGSTTFSNIGCNGVTAEQTAVTNGQLTRCVADLVGKIIVLPYANPDNIVSGVTAAMTGTTPTSLLPSPGGSLRNYGTLIYCVNSHATISTFVNVTDGSGGAVLWSIYAGAAGGGAGPQYITPIRQPTTATALFVVNVTTGANVVCNASGYKGL